jgi:hypothetical protein
LWVYLKKEKEKWSYEFIAKKKKEGFAIIKAHCDSSLNPLRICMKLFFIVKKLLIRLSKANTMKDY